jgi:hypothetical protein
MNEEQEGEDMAATILTIRKSTAHFILPGVID